MTDETRTVIELGHISGLEFECPKCGGKVLYRLAQQPESLASLCPNCNESWFAENGTPTRNPSAAEQVLVILSLLRNIGQTPSILARVRLRIEEQPQTK